MAVYTYLSESALRQYARMFGLGELLSYKEVGAGSINSIYDLNTSTGRYFFRILENRTQEEAHFEEALLKHLLQHGLSVPVMMQAQGHGGVVPYSPKQYISVFKCMDGREIGVFEVQPSHAFQIGAFIAKVHSALLSLGLKRKNHFLRAALLRKLKECARVLTDADMQKDVLRLNHVVEHAVFSARLPRGVIHGDLFVDNARFQEGVLCGVLDFEMASNGILSYDIAVALCDWAFFQNKMSYETMHALVAGYQSVRPLTALEKESLYDLCRFVAARFATSRLYDFDVHTRPEATRVYKDYRHFMARLDALEHIGRASFAEVLFSPASSLQYGVV